MLKKIKECFLVAVLILSACNEKDNQSKLLENQTALRKPIVLSLARLDSVQSFLDSLRALPRADSALIKSLLTAGNLAMTPDETIDTVTTYHCYTTFKIGDGSAQVIAIITELNTIAASLQLMVFNGIGVCTATVPLAFYYDEAGGKEQWRSVQTSSTTFLRRKEYSDFVYANIADSITGSGDPIGRGTTLVRSAIEYKNKRFYTRQIDSTYKVSMY